MQLDAAAIGALFYIEYRGRPRRQFLRHNHSQSVFLRLDLQGATAVGQLVAQALRILWGFFPESTFMVGNVWLISATLAQPPIASIHGRPHTPHFIQNLR